MMKFSGLLPFSFKKMTHAETNYMIYDQELLGFTREHGKYSLI